MHELTVALRVCETLDAELTSDDIEAVTEVRLRVGALSGIVPEALTFAWGPATSGSTLLAGSQLSIEWVDAAGRCPRCRRTRIVDDLSSFRCTVCGEPIEEVVGGHELEILSVDVSDSG